MATLTTHQATGQTDRRGAPYGWPLCAVSAALFGSLLVERVPAVPEWAPAALAMPMAGATGLVLARKSRPHGIFAAVCWLAGGAWPTWVALAGYSWLAFVALGVLGGVGVATAAALAPDPPAEVASPPPVKVEHPHAAQLRRLLDRLLLNQQVQIPNMGFVVTAFTVWEGDRGFTAAVQFPSGHRITQKRFKEVADDLAAEWRPALAAGCTVRIKDGSHKNAAIVEITLVNHLAKDEPYPVSQLAPRSSTQPHKIGFDAAAKLATINIDQGSALLNARRGGGKTVLVQDLICEIAQCTDELLWVIDLNGGGVATAFMAPFAKDQVDQPTIDWIAFDPDEALAMAVTAADLARDRKAFYAPLCVANDTDILPISPQVPGITILVDEGGEVFGQSVSKDVAQVADALLEVQRIARAMRIKLVITTQRGTASYLHSDLKKACDIRACGLVEGDDEIAHILDWDRGLAASDLARGEWFLRRGVAEAPVKIKTYAQRPSIIQQVVEITSPWRPNLDPRGREVAARRGNGLIYEQRWARARPWLRHIAGHGDDGVAPPPIVWDLDEDGDQDGKSSGKASSRGPTSPSSTTAAGVASFGRDMADRIRREVWGEGGTPPGEREPQQGQGEPEWAREAAAGLADLPVLRAPRNTEPPPLELPPAPPAPPAPTMDAMTAPTAPVAFSPGQEWLLCFMADHPDGIRTLEAVEAAREAGRTDRRATINDWIAQLRDGMNPALIEATSDYARWVLTDAGRQVAAQVCPHREG